MELALDILLSEQPKRLLPMPGRELVDVNVIKQKNDIVAVAERYTHLHKSGTRFNAKCPLHESKGLPLTIYPNDQSWYCFHCLKGGDVIDMVSQFEKTEFRQAIEVLK